MLRATYYFTLVIKQQHNSRADRQAAKLYPLIQASRLINIITTFEEHLDVSVLLSLHFKYKPSMGSMPIHEIARVKQFYWKG